LNHDDVFIVDTESKIYQFNGANSNIQERAKALEIIQLLKEKYHKGKCDVAIVGMGNFLLYNSVILFIKCTSFSFLLNKNYPTFQMMAS